MTFVKISDHPGKEQLLTWRFDWGMARNIDPYGAAPEGYCYDAVNAYYPGGQHDPITRPALIAYQTSTAFPGAITGMCVFRKDASTWFTVVACLNAGGTDQELYYLNPSTKAKVQISSALGSLAKPSFCVANGMLFVACANQYLQFWCGFTGGSPARASATITVGTIPADGDTLTVNGTVCTFVTGGMSDAIVPYKISISTVSTDHQAAVIMYCLQRYFPEIKFSATGSTSVTTCTAQATGAAGNAMTLATSVPAKLTLSGATFSGGVDGNQLDMLSPYNTTYGEWYIKPAMIMLDKTGRMVAFGDPRTNMRLGDYLQTQDDATDVSSRLWFSGPSNPFDWAHGVYGNAEYWDVNLGDGSSPCALSSFGQEIVVHKTGPKKSVFRFTILDPDPTTWTLEPRAVLDEFAALNHRCAVTVAGKHYLLDADTLRVLTGNDAYDEIDSDSIGERMLGLWSPTAAAFLAVNPFDQYLLCVPGSGAAANIYHFPTAAHPLGRWTRWAFTGDNAITAAVYCEPEGFMLFACASKMICRFHAAAFQDAAGAVFFPTTIIGRGVEGGFENLLIKGTMLEFTPITSGGITGACAVGYVSGLDTGNPVTLFSFDPDDAALAGKRAISRATGGGARFMPRVYLDKGALTLRSLRQLAALKGDATE